MLKPGVCDWHKALVNVRKKLVSSTRSRSIQWVLWPLHVLIFTYWQPVTTWYGMTDMQVCPGMCSCFKYVEFEGWRLPPATDTQEQLLTSCLGIYRLNCYSLALGDVTTFSLFCCVRVRPCPPVSAFSTYPNSLALVADNLSLLFPSPGCLPQEAILGCQSQRDS